MMNLVSTGSINRYNNGLDVRIPRTATLIIWAVFSIGTAQTPVPTIESKSTPSSAATTPSGSETLGAARTPDGASRTPDPAAPTPTSASEAPPQTVWLSDIEAGKHLALTQHKPILFYCYAPMALACRDMEQKTFVDPRVQEAMRAYVLVAMNLHVNRPLAQKLMLFRVPTIYFMDKDGQTLDRAVGYKSADQLLLYMNRFTPPVTPTAAPGAPAAPAAAPKTKTPYELTQPRTGTFPIQFHFVQKDATAVYLAGDFNDWRIDELLMKKSGDDSWDLPLYLIEGVYEYKFFIPELNSYVQDPLNPFSRPDPYGGRNSVVIAGNPQVGPRQEGNKVWFFYYNKEAAKVELGGTFNNWQPSLMYNDGRGTWGVIMILTPGGYEYKFVVDGQWMTDPNNLQETPNTVGSANSVVIVKPSQ